MFHYVAGRVQDGARTGGATSGPGPAGARSQRLLVESVSRQMGVTLSSSWGVGAAQAHLGAGHDLSMTLGTTAPMCFSTKHRAGYGLWPSMQPWCCGIWAIRTRRCRRAEAACTLAQELSHPFSLTWVPCVCVAMSPPIPPGRATGNPRVGRGSNHPLARTGISNVVMAGTVLQGWAFAEHGQRRRGDCPDPPRTGHLPGHRSRCGADILSCPAG